MKPEYKLAIIIGLVLTMPLSMPLFLYGFGLAWPFCLSLFSALTGIIFVLLYGNKENE